MAVQLKIEKDGTFTFYGRSMQPVKERNALLQPYGKQMQYYGRVLRLYPSKEQKAILNQQIGNARFVRNQYLNQRMQTYQNKSSCLKKPVFMRVSAISISLLITN